MDHTLASELLGAFVLDSCDDDEDRQIRIHLEACVECRDELDRLSSVAGLIGASDLEAPPAQLRTSLLDAAKDIP